MKNQHLYSLGDKMFQREGNQHNNDNLNDILNGCQVMS